MPLEKPVRGRNNLPLRAAVVRGLPQALVSDNPGVDFFTTEQWRAISRILGFSEREREVSRLMIEGLSRTEIATRLRKPNGARLSAETVRVYIDRIFHKAQVLDRLGLALRLVRICREFEDAEHTTARRSTPGV